MEIDGAGGRRGQARPTAQQREEWERAGFDAALAQAMFARPLLAPSEAMTKREAAPRGAEGGSADGERTPAGDTAGLPDVAATGSTDGTAGRMPVEPEAPADESTPADGALKAVKAEQIEMADPDTLGDDAQASRMAIPASFTPVSRAATGPVASISSEVGGAGAVGAGSRPEERSSDRKEPGSDAHTEQPNPPATTREEASRAARVIRPVEVSFDAGDGPEGRLRVSVQGQMVRATIMTPDAPGARELERSAPDLHRALREKGFTRTEVSIRPAPGRARKTGPDAELRVPAGPER